MKSIITFVLLINISFPIYSLNIVDPSELFFDKDALQKYRIMRNEIFARYGRTFKSKNLNTYFKEKPWYKVNPNYHDSLLTENDKDLVKKIQSFENRLKNLKGDTLEFYKKEVEFRARPDFDSVGSYLIDYTGDGKNESHINVFKKRGNKLYLQTIIIKDKDTLFNQQVWVGFAPSYFEDTEVFNDWSIMLRNNAPPAKRKSESFTKSYMPQLMASDIIGITGGNMDKTIQDAKNYLKSFKGYILIIASNESGGKAWIWYEPLKKFITFYVA